MLVIFRSNSNVTHIRFGVAKFQLYPSPNKAIISINWLVEKSLKMFEPGLFQPYKLGLCIF